MTVEELKVIVTAQTQSFNKEIDNVNKKISGLETITNKSSSAMSDAFSKVKMIVVAVAAALLTAGVNAVKAAADMETTTVAFEVMLGSAEKATKLLSQLKSFAASTPFELTEVLSASKALLAFGIDASKIESTLRSLGDIAAGVGMPLKDLAEIYGKSKTQGTLYSEDINQLTGRGIPVIKALAEVLGVTEDKVKKFASEGKIGFAQLEQAFTNLTADGSQFGGLMEKQSTTLNGLWSNMNDGLGQAAVAFGDVIIQASGLKAWISTITGGINKLTQSITNIGENGIRSLSSTFKAVLLTAGLALTIKVLSLSSIIKGIMKAMFGYLRTDIVDLGATLKFSFTSNFSFAWMAIKQKAAALFTWMKMNLATALAPLVLMAGIKVFNDYADAAARNSPEQLKSASTVAKNKTKIAELNTELTKLTQTTNDVGAATSKMLMGFDEINSMDSSGGGSIINVDPNVQKRIQEIQDEIESLNAEIEVNLVVPEKHSILDLIFGDNYQRGLDAIFKENGKTAWQNFGDGFVQMFAGGFNWWGKLFESWGVAIGKWFTQATIDIGNWFKQLGNSIGGWFNQAFIDIGKVFTPIGNIISDFFSKGWEGAKGVINSVIKPLNDLITGFNSIFKTKIPSIPTIYIAPKVNPYTGERSNGGGSWETGGIFTRRVDGATIGEHGVEAVLPLENNTSWMDILATRINGSNNNDRPVEITLQFGSTSFGKVVIDSINQLQKQEGRILIKT